MTSFQEKVAAAQAEVDSITPENAVSAARYNPDTLVIDVRDLAQIKESGTVMNAIPISLGNLLWQADHELPEEMRHPELGDKDRQIITTCFVGAMASIAAKNLQDMGYTNVRYLKGGLEGWKKADLPVQKLED